MSWSSWSAKLNVQSIVSQGLEQVNKLKEDVEKQFDQVVTASTAQPPGSSSRASATAAASAHNDAVEPPSAAVSAALFADPNINGESTVAQAPPPRSLDSKGSAALLASLGITKTRPAALDAPAPASAPTSSTSKRNPPSEDFFGSFLPAETPKAHANSNVKLQIPIQAPIRDAAAGNVEQAQAPVADDSDEKHVETDLVGADDVSPNVQPQSARDHVGFNATETGATSMVDAEEEASPSTKESTGEMGQLGAEVQEEQAIETAPVHHVDTTADFADDHNSSVDFVNEVKDEDDKTDAPAEGVVEQVTASASTDAVEAALFESSALLHAEDSSAELMALQQQLAQRETQLLSTSAVIQELHDELDKTCQREVAAVEKNRYLNEQLELLRHEVLRLNRVVAQHQQQPSRDNELMALQQAIAEKDAKLQALLDEGQALSVKQSQFEQRLRQLRREKNEEEEQKLKFQAQSDTLAIQLQETTQKLDETEELHKAMQCDLSAVQQIAERAKTELVSSRDELTQFQELKQSLEADADALRAENEELKTELDKLQHTSDSHASLSVERSEMETTIQYLQQTIQDLQVENSRRVDMARVETADLKRKWKDALGRVEALGESVSEATQPLLRQIHALQEDQRARQEAWKATENALLQRIHDAAAQRRELEADKISVSQQLHTLKCEIDDLHLEVQRKEGEAARAKERVEAAGQKEREARSKSEALQIELDELRVKLQEELHAKQALLARVAMVAAADSSAKRDEDAQVLAETTTLVAEMQQREKQLRHDLEWHQKELQRVKATTLSPRMAMLQQRRSFDEDWGGSANGSPRVSSQSSSQASILQRTLDSSADDSRLGSNSVLGMSQLQQRLRLREGENRLLRQQLQTLEDKQKQTTDEIVRLSTRNALLESSAAHFEQTQLELAKLKQKQHVLLELFGEKEEQVEELQSEVKELKAFYRKQLDTLAGQQK